MKPETAMDILQLAGRIMIENGSETYRAEDTMMRMGSALGLSNIEVFVVPSGAFISFHMPDGKRETAVMRIGKHETNLSVLDDVNCISRKLAAKDLSPEDALQALQKAQTSHSTTRSWVFLFAAALSSAGFAMMFGGTLTDAAIAAICALATRQLAHMLNRWPAAFVANSLLGSMLCTFPPLIFHLLTGLGNPGPIVAGALMPLLPGLTMTNAVQDMLRGDMVAGVTHGARALLIATLVAVGSLMAHYVFLAISGGVLL